MKKIKEECGVYGIISKESSRLANSVYYGLFALQHRGQDSCGITVNDDGIFSTYKDSGIVNDIFTPDILNSLGEGTMALGHVRYGDNKSKDRSNALPIVIDHSKGRMAISYNGSLVNRHELHRELEAEGSIFHTKSDAELISHILTKERLTSSSIEEAVTKGMLKLQGAYSILIMSPSKMIAVRDPHGFRPLSFGICDDGTYVIASETCALDSAGAKIVRDVEPGEIIIFDINGITSIDTHCNKVPKKLCIFEYLYFARPDSVVDGISVHKARANAGAQLYIQNPIEADIVIGVPDSGLDAAIGYARQSGIPYGIGFIKNKYIGRTFIAPGQSTREDKVKIKLNVLAETVRDKRVVLVDDSIVRGTTSLKIVTLLRNAGATEVHLCSSAPMFINTCPYGTDIDSKENLIAFKHSLEEMKKMIGVDSLTFLSNENLPKIIESDDAQGYCSACFDGNYPTKLPTIVEDKYSSKISKKTE